MSSLFYRSLGILVEFIQILILVRIVMSYINFNRSNSLVRLVYELQSHSSSADLSRMTGINTGMFDFSPFLPSYVKSYYGLLLEYCSHVD